MLPRLAFLCVIISIHALFAHATAPSHTIRSGTLDTNAQRLRRGRPPLPPGFKSKRSKGTPVAAAKRYQPSNAPPQTYTGNIKIVKSAGGALVGYVSNSLNSAGMYTVTAGATNRLSVSFVAASALSGTSSTQIDIQDMSNSRTSTPYVGGTGSSIASGSSSSVAVVGVAQTTPGSPPQTGSRTTSSGNIESAIWQYNPTTKVITAQWINPDSSSPTCHIMYNPAISGGGFAITADVLSYFGSHLSSYEIKLTLE